MLAVTRHSPVKVYRATKSKVASNIKSANKAMVKKRHEMMGSVRGIGSPGGGMDFASMTLNSSSWSRGATGRFMKSG